MMANSLKSKILFYFILFITIPLILSTTYIFFKMHESQKTSIYNKHLQILKRVEQESNNIVINVQETAKYIKKNFNKKRADLINDIAITSNNISSILVLDKNGKLKNSSENVHILNPNLEDFSKEVFFSNISEKQKEYWSDIFVSKISSKPSISFSCKIDENTIIVLIVSLETVNNFAKRFKSIDGESAVRIMNKDGYFLANPDHPEFVRERRNIKKSPFYRNHIVHNHEHQQIEFHDLEGNNSIAVYGVGEKLKWYILVKESYDVLFKTFYSVLWTIVFFIALIIIVSIYISIKLSKSILEPLDTLNKNMENIAEDKELHNIKKSEYLELDTLSTNFLSMQKKIKEKEKNILEEVAKNREKDIQIFEQSKMAALGEMIGNIAHQWRQPLSIISTIATAIQFQKQQGVFDSSKLASSCETINTQTQYLSRTIDDFKNFIKGDRIIESFKLKDFMQSFKHLVLPQIETSNLEMFIEIKDDIIYHGYKNELLQCIINIFNNSKDALEKNDKKLIFIDISKEDKKIIISIKDNAGGIPLSIINNIFEPYFTTKHKSKGTGLGLNMTYNLIVEGMKGDIKVINKEYKYEEITYKGANFIITLPFN